MGIRHAFDGGALCGTALLLRPGAGPLPISVRGTATPGFHLSSMILLTRQAGCGGGHLAPVASRLLALLAALQLCAALSAGLPQRHDPGRRALQAAAQAAQLPPQLPPPLLLLRRDLLSTLTPPRRRGPRRFRRVARGRRHARGAHDGACARARGVGRQHLSRNADRRRHRRDPDDGAGPRAQADPHGAPVDVAAGRARRGQRSHAIRRARCSIAISPNGAACRAMCGCPPSASIRISSAGSPGWCGGHWSAAGGSAPPKAARPARPPAAPAPGRRGGGVCRSPPFS